MNKYKMATKIKLRFSHTTDVPGDTTGRFAAESLWELPLSVIKIMGTNIKSRLGVDTGDFTSTTTDPLDQLRFDILQDVYNTRISIQAEKKQKHEDQLHNQKIDIVIDVKKQEDMVSMSVKELEKLKR